mgnify:CR=1 FL=1
MSTWNPMDRTTGKVIGYARVSTQDQAREGFSLDAQETRLRAYAVAVGRTIDEVIIDAGQSAKTLQRPGLQRLLSDVRHGSVAAIVVVKLDRLTRSVRDLADLIDSLQSTRTALVSLSESLDTGTAAGRMMLNLLASVSQWECEAIGERTAEVLGEMRVSRQIYSHVPFGYRRVADALVEHPEEQRGLQTMREMRADGKSLQSIAGWLTENGFTPRQGARRWYPQTVKDVLQSRIATAA